jgi:hypothetical protein
LIEVADDGTGIGKLVEPCGDRRATHLPVRRNCFTSALGFAAKPWRRSFGRSFDDHDPEQRPRRVPSAGRGRKQRAWKPSAPSGQWLRRGPVLRYPRPAEISQG